MKKTVYLMAISSTMIVCHAFAGNKEPHNIIQFEKIPHLHSGISFANHIREDSVHNFFNFSYIYNGAGVAVGDINNDGLTDIYFSGNQVTNKLYLNTGNFVFKDITEQAFQTDSKGWSNGVTMIDINNDGWLDIYVSRSGLYGNPADRANLLFVNNGDSTFSEQAKNYGINDMGFSTQAYFFDYDRDNDLDLFLVNHRFDFENNNTVIPRDNILYDAFTSDQLYRNNGNGSFTNVTQQSGMLNNAWGLSAVISDFNNDGWDDIYIANDYVEPDNIYINNQDGTFKEAIASHVKHSSYFSMGSDIADINNDGYQDFIVLDMVPEDHVRAKRLMAPMSTENFWRLIDSGLHYQYMLNTLQLNQGNGLYSEIAQLAGVSKTDWSWAPLFADFDNDGLPDLFITNGIKRDITDNDFFNRLNRQTKSGAKSLSFKQIISTMPSAKLQNYLYRNQGDLTFKQSNDTSHLTDLSNSNGAAYADFDNDGDLDLVINNLDETASLYNNTTAHTAGHSIKIKLEGPLHNRLGIGALVTVDDGIRRQTKKQLLSRGYLSSVDPILHFGLGRQTSLESISVLWPDGKTTVVAKPQRNKMITVNYIDSKPTLTQSLATATLFSDLTATTKIDFRHQEQAYNDFKRELLLPHKQSEHGPYLTVGDVNGDQLDDFYVGGAAGNTGQLFIQTADQQFIASQPQLWKKDAQYEDLGSLLFDADNDNDLDLYIVSGSNEFEKSSPLYQDRLYLNDGKGRFTRSSRLPQSVSSGLSVISGDYDQDGDLDLFVAGRVVPGRYPFAPKSFLLRNDTTVFTDVTQQIAPALSSIGMVTHSTFTDYDNDGDLDIIMVGEWMPITVFNNQKGQFINVTEKLGLSNTTGWWQTLQAGDFDHDGDIDFVAGNIGDNNKYQPSQSKPLTVHANDFDNNGSLDIILAVKKHNRDLPIRGRQCSAQQMPNLNHKFPTFKAFAEADLGTIYSPDKLSSALTLSAQTFSHALIINHGKDGFELRSLPTVTQLSPISGMVVDDFNDDTHLDILFTGNLYAAEVETVRYDAGVGGLLLGDGQLGFQSVEPVRSGFLTAGNARDLKQIRLGADKQAAVMVSNNNGPLQIFKLNKVRH